MTSALVRRALLVTVTTAALAGALSFPASAGASAATAKTTANSLISATGQIVRAPAGLVSVAHNGYIPKSASAADQAHPSSVIGSDERTQITNTTSFPARAIVQIKYNGSQGCTGWMISKNYLITAGHCVYNTASKTWLSGMTFTPGANGASAPYGTCGMAGHWSFTNYVNNGDSNYDIGIIKLNCTVGYSTGWFGTWWQSASLTYNFETVQGYPCDKPTGTQWTSSGLVAGSTADRLQYVNDTFNCQSGSAIWQNRSSSASYCTGYCVMGVHTTGNVGGYNSGVRFTSGKLSAIYALVNQG